MPDLPIADQRVLNLNLALKRLLRTPYLLQHVPPEMHSPALQLADAVVDRLAPEDV